MDLSLKVSDFLVSRANHLFEPVILSYRILKLLFKVFDIFSGLSLHDLFAIILIIDVG
jgi:hypothetical protein